MSNLELGLSSGQSMNHSSLRQNRQYMYKDSKLKCHEVISYNRKNEEHWDRIEAHCKKQFYGYMKKTQQQTKQNIDCLILNDLVIKGLYPDFSIIFLCHQ